MALHRGFDGDIYIGTTPTKVGQVASWTLAMPRTRINAKQLNDKAARYLPGQMDWSISAVIHFDPDDAQHMMLINQAISGTPVPFALRLTDGSGDGWNISSAYMDVTSTGSTADELLMVEGEFYSADGTLPTKYEA